MRVTLPFLDSCKSALVSVCLSRPIFEGLGIKRFLILLNFVDKSFVDLLCIKKLALEKVSVLLRVL